MAKINLKQADFDEKRNDMQIVLERIQEIRANVRKMPFSADSAGSKGPCASKTSYMASCFSLCLHEMANVVELSIAHLQQISDDIQDTDASSAENIGGE